MNGTNITEQKLIRVSSCAATIGFHTPNTIVVAIPTIICMMNNSHAPVNRQNVKADKPLISDHKNLFSIFFHKVSPEYPMNVDRMYAGIERKNHAQNRCVRSDNPIVRRQKRMGAVIRFNNNRLFLPPSIETKANVMEGIKAIVPIIPCQYSFTLCLQPVF